jgi:hypothetical protein
MMGRCSLMKRRANISTSSSLRKQLIGQSSTMIENIMKEFLLDRARKTILVITKKEFKSFKDGKDILSFVQTYNLEQTFLSKVIPIQGLQKAINFK